MPDLRDEALANPEEWHRYYKTSVDLTPVLEQGRNLGEEHDIAFGSHFDELVDRAPTEGFFLHSPIDLTARERLIPARLGSLVARALQLVAILSTSPVTARGDRSVGPRYWRHVLNKAAPPPPHADVRAVVQQTPIAQRIDVQQTIRGAPILGGSFRLHVDKGVVYAVTGHPVGRLNGRDPGARPPLDAARAKAVCSEIFEVDMLRFLGVQQVVFPIPDGAVWALQVAFVDDATSADVRAYLAADDLSLLLSYNVSAALTGRGRVYLVNPLLDPGPRGSRPPRHRARAAGPSQWRLRPRPAVQITAGAAGPPRFCSRPRRPSIRRGAGVLPPLDHLAAVSAAPSCGRDGRGAARADPRNCP